MAQSQPLRLQAKRANRVAGWLLAVLVGFLWLLAIVFALLSLTVLSQHGLIGLVAGGLVTGLFVLSAILFTDRVHDALAVYEFTLQGVSKRSPFREQRVNWSEVAGWEISDSDGIWWLLDKKGRVLLRIEWRNLPDEQVPDAKAFVVDHLSRHFLAMLSTTQTLLSRLKRFHRLIHRLYLWGALLLFASLIGAWLARRVGNDVIAATAAIAFVTGTLLEAVRIFVIIFFMPGQTNFLVCGDWLIQKTGIQTESLVTIHLPSVQSLERASDGIVLVGADKQEIFIPSHLTALLDYLRIRLPSEWQE